MKAQFSSDTKFSSNHLSSLSIVLPCYNEVENIEKVVKAALLVGKEISDKLEVIVVNDGSKDDTKTVVEKLQTRVPELVLVNQANQGYGGALKTGFRTAKMDWLFFTDSDNQFDLSELKQFVPETKSFDFVFGYRLKRADKFHRIIIAKMLKLWNKIWLNFPFFIRDIDCAFKLMRRSSFLSIGEIQSSGAMINSEFILKIHRKGYKIKQLPVHHYARQLGSATGSNSKVIIRAVKETFRLRKQLKEKH